MSDIQRDGARTPQSESRLNWLGRTGRSTAIHIRTSFSTTKVREDKQLQIEV